jgi:hypothetical protein
MGDCKLMGGSAFVNKKIPKIPMKNSRSSAFGMHRPFRINYIE